MDSRWIAGGVALVGLAGLAVWSGYHAGTEDPRIVRLAISRSGKWLAAGTAGGRVAVWRLDSRAKSLEFRSNNGALNDLLFSPDERWLAIADKGLTLRPLEKARPPLVLRSDDRNYGTVRFGATGETILTINGRGSIEVLSATTGRVVTSICCSTIAGEVAFSPDDLTLVSAGHWPRVWDARTGRLMARLTRAREFMAFGPIVFRGNSVLMGSQDGGIHIWDWRTHRSNAMSPRTTDWVDTIAVQERTGLIAYAGFGKPLRIWNPETDLRRSLSNVQPTSNIEFSSPEGSLAVGVADGAIEFWDVQRGERTAVLRPSGQN